MDLSQFTPIIITILILVVAWVVLRFVLKMAGKIFSIGCSIIVLIGIIWLLVRIFKGA
jgi:membrane protein YdbS with pleckstrin-like domain